MRWRGVVLALVAVPAGGVLPAQATLQEAGRRAREAWLVHDAPAFVGQSASIVLQIPGADPSSALGRAQAVELLRRHFQAVAEQGLTITAVRELESGRGLVELERRYVVRGTSDVRRETVFVGFRRVAGRWVVSELRSAS
ncbi:MAG: hypothetical protein HYS40_05240 [Gemmatimonadetes bacterium]|nr:hypothetical protein [Gemmatimonadota bacterium]